VQKFADMGFSAERVEVESLEHRRRGRIDAFAQADAGPGEGGRVHVEDRCEEAEMTKHARVK
jgi:hypothetical protein